MKLTIPSITIDADTFRKTTDTAPPAEYALREIHQNLTLTDDKVEAWFRLSPLAFDWKAQSQQVELLRQGALGWTGLRGRAFHLRVTQRPYPSAKWAMGYTETNQTPANPGHFRRHLLDVQKAMRGSTLSENEVYVGVVVGDRGLVNRVTAATIGHGKSLDRERQKLGDTIDEIATALHRPGLAAVPATADEVAWLTHRSVGLHLPEPIDDMPATVTEWDTAQFWENVDLDPAPRKSHITLTGLAPRNGEPITRHVAVLSLARTGPVTIPEQHVPWMAFAEQLPFPVEWSVRGNVLGGKAAAKHMQGRLKMVADQKAQLDNAGMPMGPELTRVATRAADVADEMQHAADLQATRMHGHVRVAVAGRTVQELRDNIRTFVAHYENIEFTVAWDGLGQVDLAREFVPCEKVTIQSHKRHQPVDYWTAAVPHLASTVGDRDGTYLGYTVGTSRRAVTWDMHRAMLSLEKSGFTPVLGAPGSGKSSFLALCAVRAAEVGIPTTMMDYSGLLARIAYLPRFAGKARHIDLLRSQPGTLSVYSSIPEPRRDQLRDHPEVFAARNLGRTSGEIEDLIDRLHSEASDEARLQRMQAAESMLKSLLPVTTRRQDGVDAAIGEAVAYIGGSRNASLDEVVAWMVARTGHDDKLTRRLGQELARRSEYPQTRLFFGKGPDDDTTDDHILTIMTAPGLVLPTNDDETRWSVEEQIAIPLLTAANTYASRRIYSRRMNERKLFIGDEVHVDRKHAAGRALWNRLARDSRKWRTRVLAGTQLAGDLLDLDADGLTSEVFIGRMESATDASAALKMARIPTGVGYEADVLGLSPDRTAEYRDLIFSDAHGNVDVTRIDFRYDPELLDAIKVQSAEPPSVNTNLTKESA